MSTGAVGGCSLDWPAGPKDTACAVNRTSKQQRSKVKTCLDNFMAYSPVQKWDHSFGVKPVLKRDLVNSLGNITGRAASLAACHCGGPNLPARRGEFEFRSRAAAGFQRRLRE